MDQQQPPTDVSFNDIPVTLGTTGTGDVDRTDIPDEIESITCGLASQQPPTKPIIVLTAARWWSLDGKGSTDPAFQWAIEWTRQLTTDTLSDIEQFEEFLDYLGKIGFAEEAYELC